jgi:hypothetical protein
LLGDADICRLGGDGDADPDRPAGQQRREEQLDQQVRALDDRRCDAGRANRAAAARKIPKIA